MIKIDMEMPESCEKCPCKQPWFGSFELELNCGINHKSMGNIKKRQEYCPLIEVKE